MERTFLVDGYEVSRIINGLWQFSAGHGPEVKPRMAIAGMFAAVNAEIDVFDCADHYVGVEELIGAFRREFQQQGGVPQDIKIHTKCVPDIETLPHLKKEYVERIIDRSLLRLGVDRLDLVQFHWWDYDVPGYVEAAKWLAELQQAGKIRYLGATNFDVPRLREIVESGVKIVSLQCQYSVLDRRPENGMVDFCREHDIKLLCYGTVGGGFVSEKYLGLPDPHEPLENRSLTKYKLIVDDFGGWELFQDLLNVLSLIARKHGVSITNVATRWVLGQPQVAAVIIGARNATHIQNNLHMFQFFLDDEDKQTIRGMLERVEGPKGDTYGLERVKGEKHASIMRYNLNKVQ